VRSTIQRHGTTANPLCPFALPKFLTQTFHQMNADRPTAGSNLGNHYDWGSSGEDRITKILL
jgi:hypothetical protein